MDMGGTLILMDLYMMENGLKTKNLDMGNCFSLRVQFMRVFGNVTRCMVRVTTSTQMETPMKVILS